MAEDTKFHALRKRYLDAEAKRDAFDMTLQRKYTSQWEKTWLSAKERHELERLNRAVDKAGDRFFDHLQAISPRNWRSGAPVHWLYTSLSYEDAVRPLDDRLSVTPPLSYGATSPMR